MRGQASQCSASTPSGTAKTRSPKCLAPARNASSVESTGRLPTNRSSLVIRGAMSVSSVYVCLDAGPHGARMMPRDLDAGIGRERLVLGHAVPLVAEQHDR